METPMELATLQDACASTERFVERVTPAQYDLATPCDEWDVRALLNHLLGTLALGAALLGDTAPTANMAPGELPDRDLVGDDPAKAYGAGVEALLVAAAGDALGRGHQTPLGEMPGAVLGGFTALDILVHGWDLARATSQEPSLDPDLAEQMLGFARQAISDENRAPRIGPEITVGVDAPATDRLVAYLGRMP
jgi:uncharacterized protein (TIGR03086 family)